MRVVTRHCASKRTLALVGTVALMLTNNVNRLAFVAGEGLPNARYTRYRVSGGPPVSFGGSHEMPCNAHTHARNM